MEDEVLKCRYRRDFCVLILRLIQSPDLSLVDFRNLLTSKKYTLPKTLVDSFDQILAEINEIGIGKLLDVVESLDKILSHLDNSVNESKSFTTNSASAIARTSVVGKDIYIKNALQCLKNIYEMKILFILLHLVETKKQFHLLPFL